MMVIVVSACGKQPQVVTGIKVSSSTENSNLMLSFQADLNLGNLMFPSVTLPVLHPRGQTPIGQVDLLPVLGGKNQIKVSLNVSAITDLQAQSAKLPNGNSIPLIASNPTIVIPLGAGAQLYITLAQNATAIGVAVPIKQFDSIGQAVGGVNLFPVFMIDQVMASAGVFTSRNAGQNGFAIVADVSNYIRMQDIYVPTVAALSAASQAPSQAKQNTISSMIMNLNAKKVRLQLR